MIEVRGPTKRYGDTMAVDGLTFDVRPGSGTGFLGPNGSGKSTTMRLILGLDHASAGEARVSGRRCADLRWPLREVGAVLEARACHPGRTAYDHLLALAAANSIKRSRGHTDAEPIPRAQRSGRSAAVCIVIILEVT